MRSFANREPGCGHKTENNTEDEEYGECRGHVFIISTQVTLASCACANALRSQITWAWVCITKLSEYIQYLISNQPSTSNFRRRYVMVRGSFGSVIIVYRRISTVYGDQTIRTYVVVRWWNTTRDAHLNVAHHRGDHYSQLQVRELFPDTPMPTSAERLIWTFRALANSTKPIINFLAILVSVLLKRCLCLTLWVRPPTRYPRVGLEPQRFIHLGHGRTREDIVTLWYNILRILRRCGECPRDDEIVADITYDAVDWWV